MGNGNSKNTRTKKTNKKMQLSSKQKRMQNRRKNASVKFKNSIAEPSIPKKQIKKKGGCNCGRQTR